MSFKIVFENDHGIRSKVYATSLDINPQDQLVLDGGRFIIPQSRVISVELAY